MKKKKKQEVLIDDGGVAESRDIFGKLVIGGCSLVSVALVVLGVLAIID